MAIDRAFSSWRHSTPGDNATVADFVRMESSIIAVLRRVAGYPDPNVEGGTFDPNKISTAYLSSVDTNTKNKMIADMAGLLWYRALPLPTSLSCFRLNLISCCIHRLHTDL